MSLSETASNISTDARSIIAIAQRIRADSALLMGITDPPVVDPPVILPPMINPTVGIVIKRKLTTVTPEDVPGSNTQEKIINAHAEAVDRNRPMRWDADYQCTRIQLDERHDGLMIESNGFGPVLPDDPDGKDAAWGWLYHAIASAGTTVQVNMRGVKIDGNRAKAARQFNHTNTHTQHGVVLGDVGAGRSRVVMENCITRNFDGAGAIVLGDGSELVATDHATTGNGYGGIESTRGRMYLTRVKAFGNGGHGINPSAAEFVSVNDCDIFNNGAGMKVSKRADGTSHPAKLHIFKTRIYDNKGVGLAATSSGAGTIITGDQIEFSRNGGGSINLTTNTGEQNDGRLILGRVVCTDNVDKIDDNSTDILIFGGGWHANIADLSIRGSGWRGIGGGWGSRFEIGRLQVDSCAGPGVRWNGGTLIVDERVIGNNGAADEVS